jgi:hypothetical protein
MGYRAIGFKAHPDWLVAAVESSDAAELAELVTLRRHSATCLRCEQERAVWTPEGHAPRDVDFGACPRCNLWSPPTNLDMTWGFSPELLHIGSDGIAWHELSDRSLLEVARFESYRLPMLRNAAGLTKLLRPLLGETVRRDLSFALTEATYRNLLPKPDDLRVAWDLALSDGRARSGDEDTLSLADVWALYWYPMEGLA